MAKTVPLERRWPDLYAKGFRPASKADQVRATLISGKRLGPFGSDSERAHVSGLVTQIERLGYVVERGAAADGRTTYQITNPEHRPSAADFQRERDYKNGRATGGGNGAGTAVVRRGGIRDLAAMLPPIGGDLTCTAVGFGVDGAPFVVVTSAEGWRYSCQITDARPPQE